MIASLVNVLVQDNGDGIGPYNATASWGTGGAADSFSTFMDSTTYTSKLSANEPEVHEKTCDAVVAAAALTFVYLTVLWAK